MCVCGGNSRERGGGEIYIGEVPNTLNHLNVKKNECLRLRGTKVKPDTNWKHISTFLLIICKSPDNILGRHFFLFLKKIYAY